MSLQQRPVSELKLALKSGVVAGVPLDAGLDALPARWAMRRRAEVFVEVARREDALVVPRSRAEPVRSGG